jgi:hypothetical protein
MTIVNPLTIDSPVMTNTFQEHKTDVLSRLNPNLVIIGKGQKT